jgi:hypothetical protein
MTDSDPFDPANVKLDHEAVKASAERAAKKTAEKPAREPFVMLPYEQLLQGAGAMRNAAMAVAIELDHLVFRTHRNPVELTNTPLRDVGICREAKIRALRKLEQVGLVAVVWRGQRAPLVTVLWRPCGAQAGDDSFQKGRKRLSP